jgi:hypothetical protein
LYQCLDGSCIIKKKLHGRGEKAKNQVLGDIVKRMASCPWGKHHEVTRKRVLCRGAELTGKGQAATVAAGKIERSAEALRV